MRIALLTDGIWPDTIGGMQKHSFYLAKYLSLNGIQVDLYYCANDAGLVIKQFSFDETLNIKFFKVDFPKSKLHYPGHYVINSYRYSKRLYQLYNQQSSYDFIYAQGFTGWYFVNKGIKLGSNLHGLEMFQKAFGFKSRLIQYLLRIPARILIRKSYISFSLGGKLTDILLSQRANIIKVTPIGIGEEWLNKTEITNKKIHFVFVGRNEKRKGLHQLFEVLEKLDHTQFVFHFIGSQKPGIFNDRNNLIFHGELKETLKIQQILSWCDCLVCPSIAEGMPTVILEAMGIGLSIIATDTGATALLVDNKNGLLIEPGNIKELIKSIQHYLTIEPEELKKLKDTSYQKVSENFIWPVSIKATIAALQP